MSSWANRIKRKELEHISVLNQVSMTAAGFQPDPGRQLSPEEIQNINITPPERIRDCGFKPQYYWGRISDENTMEAQLETVEFAGSRALDVSLRAQVRGGLCGGF